MVTHPDLPLLTENNHAVTSLTSGSYNCVGWAVGDNTRNWWPTRLGGYYWPPGAPSGESVPSFVETFLRLGYEECASDEVEAGYDKIVLYAVDGSVKHAARQLDDGRWTSKLGPWVDIEHLASTDVSGPKYGVVAAFLRRDKSLPPIPRTPPERNESCWCESGRKFKNCHGQRSLESGATSS
jgi:SEC-C motif